MTQKANINKVSKSEMATEAANVEIKVGDKVYNTEIPNFGLVGEVITLNNELRVKYTLPETKKTYKPLLSALWQLLPSDVSETVLDAILTQETAKPTAAPSPKMAIKSDAKPEPETKPEFVPLSAEETKRKNEIEKKIAEIDTKTENLELKKCELLDEYRDAKLYRADYATFEECALKVFGLKREIAQYKAAIGAFYRANSEFVLQNKLSMNAIAEMVVAENRISASLEVKKTAPEFKAITDSIIDAATKAGTDGKKVKITPRIIKAVSDSTSEVLSGIEKPETGDFDILALAKTKLGEKSADILSKTLEAMQDKDKSGKTPGSGTTTSRNDDAPAVYTGDLPTLSIVCSLHGETKLHFLGNGTAQLKCLCKVRMNGFAVEFIQVGGANVKKSAV